jgi:uncharacterized RDD family membrane protein YckC
VSVPPGWYRDPAEPTVQRWWDGEGWIGSPLPADQTPPDGPPPEPALATGHGGREPQVPAVPGPPGAAEPSVPPPAGDRRRPRGAAVPPGWGYRRPPALDLGSLGSPPRPHGYQLASLGSRLVARLVDIGLVLGLNVLVNGWFVYQFWIEISPVVSEAWRRSLAGESMSDLPETGDAGNFQLVILLLAAALWFAYEVPAVANTGQTPGKRLLRIKVMRLENAEPLGFGRSFRRWNTMGLPTLLWWCFGIGFLLQLADALFVLFDRPLQQALHDKSAYTVVVSVAAAPAKEPPDEPPDPS